MKKISIILIVITCSTVLYGQQFELETTIFGYIQGIFDFDGDGVCEYIIDSNKVYDGATNQLKYNFPGYAIFEDYMDALNPYYKYPFIDFNNDGIVDIITTTYGYDDGPWRKVFIYDMKNNDVLYEFSPEQNNSSFEYLLDFDGDGELEILISSYNTEEDYKVSVYSTGLTTSLSRIQNSVTASEYKLSQNYPNPFNPTTTIKYKIPSDNIVSVKIYDINGQLIKNLVDEYKFKGNYQIIWNGDNDNGGKVSSGTYFYQIAVGDFVKAKKMILLK